MFTFSLAKELKMTVRQLEQSMGADEFVDWIAYSKLQDDKEVGRIEALIRTQASDDEKNKTLFAFLSTLGKAKKI